MQEDLKESKTDQPSSKPEDFPRLRKGRLRDNDYWLYMTQHVTPSELFFTALVKLLLWARQSTKLRYTTLGGLLVLALGFSYWLFNPIPNSFIVYGKTPSVGVFLKDAHAEDSKVKMVGVGQYSSRSMFTDLAVRLFYREGFEYLTKDIQDVIENYTYDHVIDSSDLTYQSKLAAFIHVNEYLRTPVEWSSKTLVVKSAYKNGYPPTLLPNDEILTINGQDITGYNQADFTLMAYDNILYDVEVRRGESIFETRLKLNSFTLQRYYYLHNQRDVDSFNTYFSHDDEYYSGTSATLSIALQYYLDRTDQTLPNEVALTGSLTAEGVVEQVGGVAAKTITVHRAGIKTFFVPPDKGLVFNYSRALEVRKGMSYDDLTIVEVVTFSDVINHLNLLPRQGVILQNSQPE